MSDAAGEVTRNVIPIDIYDRRGMHTSIDDLKTIIDSGEANSVAWALLDKNGAPHTGFSVAAGDSDKLSIMSVLHALANYLERRWYEFGDEE